MLIKKKFRRSRKDRLRFERQDQDFRKAYPSIRVIIDCTEVNCAMPRSLLLNSELFSTHKNHTTLNGLVGISLFRVITLIRQQEVYQTDKL